VCLVIQVITRTQLVGIVTALLVMDLIVQDAQTGKFVPMLAQANRFSVKLEQFQMEKEPSVCLVIQVITRTQQINPNKS
jgi:hypothetical protein